MNIRFPHGLSTADFLAEYWQRKPLLMRAALPPPTLLSAQELAGLACEADVESRLVIKHPEPDNWEVRHGPFDDEVFRRLPQTHWTLLVQDVDKWVAGAAAFTERFSFLPDWRVDDVMVSYAVDQGSVGPHTDEYDVFLVQASGRRQWKINETSPAESGLIPALDLRILNDFNAQRQWTLNPGDMLYLPPGVAHWGIGLGECITWSLGFRAPRINDLTTDWTAHLLESDPGLRYGDAGIPPTSHPAEVTDETIKKISRLVDDTLKRLDTGHETEFLYWFLAYITETKENISPLPPESPISSTELARRLKQGDRLVRAPGARLLFYHAEDALCRAASGQIRNLSAELRGIL
jgi:50S ribosomal protein L16 3-hydroxylase